VNWPLKRLLFEAVAPAFTIWLVTGMPSPTDRRLQMFPPPRCKHHLDAVHSNGYSFQIEMTTGSGATDTKSLEVPITFTERVEAIPNCPATFREAFLDGLVVWLQNGLRRWPHIK